MTLKLLPHLGADGRDGHVQGVHGLDLGCLKSCASRQPGSPVFHNRYIAFSSSFSLRSHRSQGIRTARSQSRYELSTRLDASSQFAARRGMSAQWPQMWLPGGMRTLARSLRKVCGVDHGCCVFGLPSNASGISCYEALALRCTAGRTDVKAGRSVVVSNRR